MRWSKGRLELVIRPRGCVWKATTSYAPGLLPSWRHRREERHLAQRLRLLCGTQGKLLGPLGGAWPGTPSSGLATLPARVHCVFNSFCLAAATFPIGFSRWSPVVMLRCLGPTLATNCKRVGE